MSCTRAKIVAQARSWIGLKESDGSHKTIIDVYNSHAPKARCYTLKVSDAWCAGFASACAIACGATDIIPTEVSCQKLIELFKEKGIWVEDDSYIPQPGDYIFFDWQDTGVGDNQGASDHVGIVEKVVDGVITTIEGNYSNSVKRRTLKVNGKYIRGYGVPKYDAEESPAVQASEKADKEYTVAVKRLSNGSKGSSVKALQALLVGYGGESAKAVKNAGGVDGEFGSGTEKAVRAYQRSNGLDADGIVGPKTWAKLLGV